MLNTAWQELPTRTETISGKNVFRQYIAVWLKYHLKRMEDGLIILLHSATRKQLGFWQRGWRKCYKASQLFLYALSKQKLLTWYWDSFFHDIYTVLTVVRVLTHENYITMVIWLVHAKKVVRLGTLWHCYIQIHPHAQFAGCVHVSLRCGAIQPTWHI